MPGGLDRPLCPGERERESERERERDISLASGGGRLDLSSCKKRERDRCIDRQTDRLRKADREAGPNN